ncbi:MAG: thiosulfate oxidation carrier complex protein SoxZ, partial [Hyphomicrobium sp.]
MSGKPRVNLPQSIKAGDVIEVRSLISHVMETGNRKDNSGNVVPRNIINTFSATFAGKDVFRAELNSGISANPFISFH